LLLAIYQAQIVPQQNAQTELEHHQETRDELRSLHHAISAVGADETPRFQSVKLGTSYESRTLGINPPPPAGTIRTEEHNITIADASEPNSSVDIPTQFIEYQPGYNELEIGSTWYENSVLYFDGRDTGNSVSIIEDQEMIDGDNLTVVSLNNSFEQTETGRTTLELYPPNDQNETKLPEVGEDGEYNVTIPTRLSGGEYWNDTLGDSKFYNGINNMSGNDELRFLNLTVAPASLNINSVGIRLEPDKNVVEDSKGSQRAEDGDIEIKEENGKKLSGAQTGNANSRYSFTITNNGASKLNITSIEILDIIPNQRDAERVHGVPLALDSFDDDYLIIGNTMELEETYSFANEVVIDSGDSLEFEFDEFVRANGNSAPMQNQDIEIRIWAEDEGENEIINEITLSDEK